MIKPLIKRLVGSATAILLASAISFAGGCSRFVSDGTAENDGARLYDTGNITLYRFDGGTVGMTAYDDDWYNGFLEYYRTQFGGTVSTVAVEWEGWEKRFNTDLASGTAPDLITLFEKNYVDLLNRDLLVSVQELRQQGIEGIDHPSLFIKQDLAAELYSTGGKTYTIACAYAEADMIFVNEDLFTRYGVKSPYEYYTEGHWDMDAFMKCVKSMTHDLDGDGKNDLYGYYGWDPYCFIVSAGGHWIDFDRNGQLISLVQSENARQGFKNYRTLYSGRYATDHYSRWLTGTTAMTAWLPQNEYGNLVDSRLGFKWSVVPFPLDKGNTDSIRPGKCYGWAITQSSVNRQCCVNYVVALNAYSIVNPNPTQQAYNSAFSSEQREMFSDCTQNVSIPIYNGVGQLGTAQWNIWGALSDPAVSFDEVMNSVVQETKRQMEVK